MNSKVRLLCLSRCTGLLPPIRMSLIRQNMYITRPWISRATGNTIDSDSAMAQRPDITAG